MLRHLEDCLNLFSILLDFSLYDFVYLLNDLQQCIKMAYNPKMTPEYRRRVRHIKRLVRGKYTEIAENTGVSKHTVDAVMNFRFMNEAVFNEACRLAYNSDESLNNSTTNFNASQQFRRTA